MDAQNVSEICAKCDERWSEHGIINMFEIIRTRIYSSDDGDGKFTRP